MYLPRNPEDLLQVIKELLREPLVVENGDVSHAISKNAGA
jgi:hypothetical protein